MDQETPASPTQKTNSHLKHPIREDGLWVKNRPVIYFLAIFFISILGSHLLYNYANRQVGKNGFNVEQVIKIDTNDCSEQDIMSSIAYDYSLMYQRLSQQLEYSKKREGYHLRVITFFNAQYFSVVTVASVAAVLAAVFLFLILRVGWDHTSPEFHAVFLGLFATTAFFSIQPSLYSHEENILSHQLALTGYRGIHDNILSVVSTKMKPPMAKKLPTAPASADSMDVVLKDLIWNNDQLFAKYKINISIDASHIPSYQNLANGLEF